MPQFAENHLRPDCLPKYAFTRRANQVLILHKYMLLKSNVYSLRLYYTDGQKKR